MKNRPSIKLVVLEWKVLFSRCVRKIREILPFFREYLSREKKEERKKSFFIASWMFDRGERELNEIINPPKATSERVAKKADIYLIIFSKVSKNIQEWRRHSSRLLGAATNGIFWLYQDQKTFLSGQSEQKTDSVQERVAHTWKIRFKIYMNSSISSFQWKEQTHVHRHRSGCASKDFQAISKAKFSAENRQRRGGKT